MGFRLRLMMEFDDLNVSSAFLNAPVSTMIVLGALASYNVPGGVAGSLSCYLIIF